ncbi:MAG: addiction module protein [Pseudomonadales bacterium]
MSNSTMKIPPPFQDASLEERIEFVQMLWDEIARNADSVPVIDEHRAILDERIRTDEEDRNSGEPWGVVRDRILADLRSR